MLAFVAVNIAVLIYVVHSRLNGSEPNEYILHFPTQNNPLNISVSSDIDKNYFMIIGDWGAPDGESTYKGIQQVIANKMLNYYKSQKEKGYNLLFIAAVGDNFYWTGQDCNEFYDHWSSIYGELTTFPWLGVFGNHDWGNSDPWALCAWNNPKITIDGIPYHSNQLNKDKDGCNPDNFYIPDFGYYYRIDELNFELIAVDENSSDCPGGLGGNGPNAGASELFKNCGGSTSIGCGYLDKIRIASENMMIQRAKESKNKNFIIINHYPGIGANLVDEFCKYRNSSDLPYEMIVAAYGHTHSQHCDRGLNTLYGYLCNAILTGGGGGCCDESTRRGFFPIGFNSDKHMIEPLNINDEQISCQYPCGVILDEMEQQKMKTNACCHTNHNKTSNSCNDIDFDECK